jgi:hypothetical protein
MRLIELKLKNFKGLREFVFVPNGANANVFGANAAGKTTIADGWSWLITGKDSLNRTDFEVKPLDSENQSAHMLEHEVEGTLLIAGGRVSDSEVDAETLNLKKVLIENWVKKKGTLNQEFTGHTVKYFVDGVPVKQKEYEERISQLASEQVLKLLTNPRYFSESKDFTWQKRRSLLLEVCGDITDQDVYGADPKLAELPAILGKRSIDDYRAILTSKKTSLNKEISDIPVRISEQHRGIVDAGKQDGPVRAKLAEVQTSLAGLQQELATLEAGGAIAIKAKRVLEIDAELIEIENQESQRSNQALGVKRNEYGTTRDAKAKLLREDKELRQQVQDSQAKVAEYQGEIVTLRNEWIAKNEEVFKEGCDCPTCGQPIPESIVQASLAKFNMDKAKALKKIESEANKFKAFCEKHLAVQKTGLDRLTAIQTEVAELDKKIAQIEGELNNPPKTAADPRAILLAREKTGLETEIAAIKEGRGSAITETKEKIAVAEHEIEEYQKDLAQIEQDQKAAGRIKDLKAEEKRLNADYETAEKELFLCNLFITTKAQMLTSTINSRFNLVTFKLFSTNINGGIEPCCEPLLNGVPYAGNLSNSERLRVGLDIINTLSEHYGIHPPVFCDNAESTTRFPEMKNQMIKLYVSEADKTLRIEMENEHERRQAA